MKPEKRNLIHDLLDERGAARRESTFIAGGRILRWRRWRRGLMQGFAVLVILALTASLLYRIPTSRPRVTMAVAAPPALAQSLTDDQLLALFPNTPVGLAVLENGKKQLLFPRPGDEERFISRF
jgi:hypothetical protein